MMAPTVQKLRSFGFTLGGAFVAVGAFLLFKGRNWQALLLGSLSLLFFLLGLVAPRSLYLVYRPWMGLAHWMGTVMTHVLMTIFFFTFLVPFTLVRLGDPLRLRRGASSYWEPYRNSEPTLERFRRPF